MSKQWILAVAFLFINPAAFAQQGNDSDAISFKDYLSQVMDYYPLLRKEQASVEAAIAQKAMAAAGRMPKLWGSIKSEYGNDPVYVFGALLRQNKFTSADFDLERLNTPSGRSNYSAEFSAEWLLFDFSATSSRISSAASMIESAQFQQELIQKEAILAASEIYSRLACTDQWLKVLEEESAQANEDVRSQEVLAKEGLVLGADFYLARMAQSYLKQQTNEVTAQHAALSMVFNILRGFDVTTPVSVHVPRHDTFSVDGPVVEWIDKTISKRPDILAMQKVLEASGARIEVAKNDFYPKVVAYAGASENVHKIGDSPGENYLAGIKATVNFFQPGHNDKITFAKKQMEELEAQYQSRLDEAVRDIAQMYYRLQALKENRALAEAAHADSKEAVRFLMPLFREGRRSIAEVTSTRVKRVESWERWLKLNDQYQQGYLTMTFYAGELTAQSAEAVYGE